MRNKINKLIKIYEDTGYESAVEYFDSLTLTDFSNITKEDAEIRLFMAKLCLVENRLSEINHYLSVGLTTDEKNEYERLKNNENKLVKENIETKKKEGFFPDECFITNGNIKILKEFITWEQFFFFIKDNWKYNTMLSSESENLRSMTWQEANMYCNMLSEKLNKKIRLPRSSEIIVNKDKLHFDDNPTIYEWCIDQPGNRENWHNLINCNLKVNAAKQYGKFYNLPGEAAKVIFRIVVEV